MKYMLKHENKKINKTQQDQEVEGSKAQSLTHYAVK